MGKNQKGTKLVTWGMLLRDGPGRRGKLAFSPCRWTKFGLVALISERRSTRGAAACLAYSLARRYYD